MSAPFGPTPVRRGLRAAAMLPLLAALLACGHTDARVGTALAEAQAAPGRANTRFTEPLACLNEQLRARSVLTARPTRLGAGTLPDATGRVSPGLRMMATTAMVRASSGSTVFIVAESLSLARVPPALSGAQQVPDGVIIGPAAMPADSGALQIYGALTQADRGIAAEQHRVGAGTRSAGFGIEFSSDIANVAIDMHIAHVQSGVILHSVANQLTLRNRGRGASADFRIGSIGANISISFEEREGVHQAVRTLVELGVLELLGRQAGVPFWHCLQLDRNNPAMLRQIATWYQGLSAEALDAHVRNRLRVLGYTVPDAPASMAPALGTFQRDQRLVPSGQPSFETFAALMDAQIAAAPPGRRPSSLPDPQPAGPRQLRLDVTELAVAEPLLQLSVQPDRVSNVVCYYRDDTGAVWRLLPNRYQPAAMRSADIPTRVPEQLAQRPVVQPQRMTPAVGFLCAASGVDWATALPAAAWGTDLARLPGASFEGLSRVLAEVGGADVGVVVTTRGNPAGRWSSISRPQQ